MPNSSPKKKTNRWLVIPALLVALASAAFIAATLLQRAADGYYRQRYLDFAFTNDHDYTESAQALDNPEGGFYCLHGYLLSEDTTEESLDELLARDIRLNESDGLVLLEINLLRYRDTPLTDAALTQLRRILDAWEKADYRLILRFLYDWDGNAAATEPQALSQILEHMTQVAPAVNEHAASVYLLQGIFVGAWGEMHGSDHMQAESMCALMEHLNEVIDPGIFLAVRTPAQRRTILNSAEAFPDNSGLALRLGLYNDGMLGSDIDLGTYGDVDQSTASSLSDRWLRGQELDYQDALCRYVPNGGEVVIDNPLNDLAAAIEAFRVMHVSYLNRSYQLEVLDKWRADTMQTDDSWNGMDGFTYIERHLSPRYRCTGADASAFNFWEDDTATCSLTLTNTAFAGARRPLACCLRIVSATDNRVVFEQDIDPGTLDADASTEGTASGADAAGGTEETGPPAVADRLQTLCNGEEIRAFVTLPLRELADGTYRILLSCEYTRDGQRLALANDLPETEHGYEIASFTLSRTPAAAPAGRELIRRYLSHWSAQRALAK